MKIIRGLINLPVGFSRSAVTIGNFDGLHLGHQALIARLKRVAACQSLTTVVIVFEPQPLEFFAPQTKPARLNSLREKFTFFAQLGIDYLLVIPFNQRFANLSAMEFIEHGLIKQLNAQYVLIGDDFRFGRQRQGDALMLSQYAQQSYFEFESMPTFEFANIRVSSTAVREALLQNDFMLATRLLGRPYIIQGRVIYGNQLARQLGFPTANIKLSRQVPALRGVYLVKIYNLETKQHYTGIANIGLRPTVDGKKATLEVHIFDFSQSIYGQYLQIEFVEKIRDEVKFNGLDELKAQIAQDICIAKQIQAKFYSDQRHQLSDQHRISAVD